MASISTIEVAWGGVRHLRLVGLRILMLVQNPPPIFMTVELLKFVPVRVISVPPKEGPLLGSTAVTVSRGRFWSSVDFEVLLSGIVSIGFVAFFAQAVLNATENANPNFSQV